MWAHHAVPRSERVTSAHAPGLPDRRNGGAVMVEEQHSAQAERACHPAVSLKAERELHVTCAWRIHGRVGRVRQDVQGGLIKNTLRGGGQDTGVFDCPVFQ